MRRFLRRRMVDRRRRTIDRRYSESGKVMLVDALIPLQ